jgi:hypothetical protein
LSSAVDSEHEAIELAIVTGIHAAYERRVRSVCAVSSIQAVAHSELTKQSARGGLHAI